MSELRIAYVAGLLEDWRDLSMLEDLPGIQVDVHAIQCGDILNNYRSNLRLFLYENVQDMPGYMRGLEEKISHSQLIISREVSSLSSFQATRVARKYSIPNLVMVSETRPNFYKNHENITAIQSDVLNSSTGFIAFSLKSEAMLNFYGVSSDKITMMNPSISSGLPHNIEERGAVFRRRAGLKEDDIVFGVFSPLDKSAKLTSLLGAIKLLKAKNPYDIKRNKFIIIGNGDQEKQLKYLAHEMGIADTILFLHENYQIYYWDLMSSFNYVLHLEPHAELLSHHDKFPRYLLDAVAAKTVALVHSGGVGKELLGENAVSYADDSEYGLCQALQACVDGCGKVDTNKESYANRVISVYSPHLIQSVMNRVVRDTVNSFEHLSYFDRYQELDHKVKKALHSYDFSSALLLVEEGILVHTQNPKTLSALWKYKGDIFLAKNETDGAVEAYSRSIEYDHKNMESYLALGKVSFNGQAYSDAIAFFKKAIALAPDSIEAMVGLGVSYQRNQMHNEGLYWLRKAVIKEGQKGKALTAFIQSVGDCPSPSVAVSALESVIEVIGESSKLWMTLGRLYLKLGKAERGHFFVQKALDYESDAS